MNCRLLVLLLLGCPAVAWAEDDRPVAHATRAIQGWTVRIDERLLSGPEEALGILATGLLEGQLRTVALVLPAEKVKRLRDVPIWLDLNHGALESPQYHPSVDWLQKNGYSRELGRAVHLPKARYFTSPRFQRMQPSAVLHELAHAYHDQVLGFEEPRVVAAWEQFSANEQYKTALHVDGRPTPHYARTNAKEFFAEMTESYFGQNDFFPFNSGELSREEPRVFELLTDIWGPLP